MTNLFFHKPSGSNIFWGLLLVLGTAASDDDTFQEVSGQCAMSGEEKFAFVDGEADPKSCWTACLTRFPEDLAAATATSKEAGSCLCFPECPCLMAGNDSAVREVAPACERDEATTFDGAVFRDHRYYLTPQARFDLLVGGTCVDQTATCSTIGSLADEGSAIQACAMHCFMNSEHHHDAAELNFVGRTCCCRAHCDCVDPNFFSVIALDHAAPTIPSDCIDNDYTTYYVDAWCGANGEAAVTTPVKLPSAAEDQQPSPAEQLDLCWAACLEEMSSLVAVVADDSDFCRCFDTCDCALTTDEPHYLAVSKTVETIDRCDWDNPMPPFHGKPSNNDDDWFLMNDMRSVYENHFVTIDGDCAVTKDAVCSVAFSPDNPLDDPRYLCFTYCAATFGGLAGATAGNDDQCCCLDHCDCLNDDSTKKNSYVTLRVGDPYPTTCDDGSVVNNDDDDDGPSFMVPQSAFAVFQGAEYVIILALIFVALVILAVFAEIAYQHHDDSSAGSFLRPNHHRVRRNPRSALSEPLLDESLFGEDSASDDDRSDDDDDERKTDGRPLTAEMRNLDHTTR